MAESRSAPREPQGLSIVAHGESPPLDIRSPSPLSYLLLTAQPYSLQRTPQMDRLPARFTNRRRLDSRDSKTSSARRPTTDATISPSSSRQRHVRRTPTGTKMDPGATCTPLSTATRWRTNTLASDGHDLFIYDSDLGRYVPGENRAKKNPRRQHGARMVSHKGQRRPHVVQMTAPPGSGTPRPLTESTS